MTIDKNKIQVIEILNPLDPGAHKSELIEYRQGKTLADLYPTMVMKSDYVFSVNGKLVAPQDTALTYPQRGDTVVVCPVLAGSSGGSGEGGGGGKSILRIVAMVALAYFTGGAGGFAAGLSGSAVGTLGYSIAYAGIMMAGSMLINAMLPPPKSKTSQVVEADDTPTYGIDGPKNSSAEGIVVPVIYGTHRYGGNLINAYVTNESATQYLHLLFNCGEGPIGGISDVLLNDTPIANYGDYQIDARLGLPNQAVIPWFGQQIVPHNVGAELTTTWLNYTTDGEVDQLRFDVAFPNGHYGAWENKADNYMIFTPVLMQYRKVGTEQWSDTANWVCNGNQKTVQRWSFFTPPLEEAKYEVRLMRDRAPQSPQPGSKMIWMDNVYLTDVNEIEFETVSYKNTALLGIRVRLTDQLSGLPQTTHMNGGKVIRCWDATTGAWVDKASSNPAWIALDALTNKRYGGGYPMARFDLEKWKEWAAHCDANGLKFNGVFDTQSNVWDATQPVFRAGHAGRTNVGTRFSVAIERAEAPRMMFSVANMIQGTFKQNWLSSTDRANELEITWIDKDDGYRQKNMRVVDKLQYQRPPKSAQVNFQGLTSFDEVWRDANILLNQNRLLLQTCEWSSPLEAIACSVGDVVLVQHDMPKWSLAGRLEAGSTSTIVKLDRPVQMTPGEVYSVLVHMSAIKRTEGVISFTQGTAIFISGYDGSAAVKRCKVAGRDVPVLQTIQQGNSFGVILGSLEGIAPGMVAELWDTDAIETRIVVNSSMDANADVTELILTAPLPADPDAFAQWMFGKNTRTGKPFRIRSITGTHDYRRDISALEYNADAYSSVPAPTPPNYSDIERFVKQAIIDGVDEEIFIIGPTTRSRVTVRYHGADELYFSSNVYMTRNGADEIKVGEDSRSITIEADLGDELVFRVVARDGFQRSAPRSTAPTIYHYVNGRTKLPNDATGLKAHVESDAWVAEWDASTDPDVNATELRIDGDTWETAALLWRGSATSARFAFQSTGQHVLRVRHCIGQTDGLYSGDDCLKTITVEPPLQPILTAGVAARVLSLDWQECTQTQPLRGYSIQVGPNSLELETLGFTTGQHYQKIERTAGTRLYWVTAIDAVGNKSAPGQISVETLPEVGDAIDDLQEGLDEAVADLLNINTGMTDAILAEAAARGTALSRMETVVNEGLEQLAEDVVLLTARAVGYTRGNLVYNGGFEFSMDEWTGDVAGFVIQDTNFGHLAMHPTPPAAGEIKSKPFPVVGSLWYSATGDARVESLEGAAVFGIEFYNQAGELLDDDVGAPIVHTDFTNEQGARNLSAAEAQAPATAVTARLTFGWSDLSVGELGVRYCKCEQGKLPSTAYTSEATDIGALAALKTESLARVNGDQAEATARLGLAASIDGKIAAVDEEFSAVADRLSGLSAKWGIKVTAGDKVAGISLNNDGAESSFIVLVDKFAVALPTGAGVKYPFVVGSIEGTPTVGIDGNLVVDGTILTRALSAESVTADKIKAGAITSDRIAAGAITADLINVGVGRNLLSNSTWLDYNVYSATNMQPVGWEFAVNLGSSTWEIQRTPNYYPDWVPPGMYGIDMHDSLGFQAGGYMIAQSRFPAVAGKRYEASIYSGAHRSKIVVELLFFNEIGTNLPATQVGQVVNNAEMVGGKRLDLFKRIGTFAVAPTGTAYAYMRVTKTNNAADAHAFLVAPQAAEATSAQTVFSPYQPAGLGTSITPAGITTPSLSALSATIGLLRTATGGARVEIESNQIRVFDGNNVLRVRIGIW